MPTKTTRQPMAQMLVLLGEVNAGVASIKEQVAVLRERVEGAQRASEDRFKHLETRLQTDTNTLSNRLHEDRKALDSLGGEVNKLRNDLNALTAGLSANNSGVRLDEHEKKITKLTDEVTILKEVKAKAEGAAQLGKALWAVFGGLVVAAIAAVVKLI